MSFLWCTKPEDPGLQICCSTGGTAYPAEEDHGKTMEATSIQGPASYGGQQKAMLMRNEGASESLMAMLGSPAGLRVPHSGHGNGVAAGVCGQKRPYYGASTNQDRLTVEEAEDGDEGLGDDCSPHVEKKRRLTVDQVRSLERNFEVDNKLEPERKMQLAKELGLQPRQVAVWFQNRRARWKTKQLERDYEVLTIDYEMLKADLEVVQREREELKAEVERLLMKNHQSEKSEPTDSRGMISLSNEKSICEPTAPCSVKLESDCCDREDPSAPARLQIHQQANSRSPPTIDVRDVKSSSSARVVEVKEELTTTSSDSNSSDILDADSPRTTDSTRSLSTSVQAEALNPKALGQSSSCPQVPPESFVDPCNLLPSICEEDMSTAGKAGLTSRQAGIMKLEDGSTGFHDDHSCNYLLPQLDEQCNLPWWDWS